jgi:hypothetical protein
MNAIIVALLGSCLMFVAYGIPVIPSLKDEVHVINYNKVSSEQLGNSLSSGKVHQKLSEIDGEIIEPEISTSYSSDLSLNSGMFYRPFGDPQSYYYYQAIQVYAPISAPYTFTSDSILDTMGFLYDTSFDPSVPNENFIVDDDDSADIDLQFRIEAFLEAGHPYILVVTTHRDALIGSFSITVNGPAAVDLLSITPTTSQPLIMPSVVPMVSSSYSSSLSSSSGIFQQVYGDPQHFYYFQAIQVTASTSGTYTFTSSSQLDTVGYFYDTSFDPSVPTENLITDDDDDGDDYQFSIEAFLEAGHTYILVVTTHGESETGGFSVSANGPDTVSLLSITPTTSQAITIPSTEPSISSAYSSLLSSSSGIFQRVYGDPQHFYYFQAIQVTVPTSGTYTFTSNSELDTMGYFYYTSFDPSVPTENLISDNDDDGDDYQFSIQAFLEAGHTYILVVTTHGESETGSFSVSASGPDTVNLLSITPTTSQAITIPTTEPSVSSSFSSELSTNSLVFHRPDRDPEENYYYQAIEVIVPTSGTYMFTSDSELDTMGFFYDTSFDPSSPTTNLITEDDDGGAINLQFQIEAHLEAGHTYILVITTHGESETGSFSVSAVGSAPVALQSSTL